MKYHALLGLILGLMATVKLGGQELPVLFNVEFNGTLVTIRPAPGAELKFATSSPGPALGLNTSDGITLINFFESTFSGSDQGIENNSLGVLRNSQSASFPDLSFPTTLMLLGAAPNDGFTTLSTNIGRNIVLQSAIDIDSGLPLGLALDTNAQTFVSGGVLQFRLSSAPNVPNSIYTNILEHPNQAQYNGPLLVYAGYNYAFGGDSLIGTYTITAVPEPSTYAAIAGGLGLVVAVLHRRRQRARATAA